MGERGEFFCHFTHFNRRTVNGPFLSGTGINQEVSGGCWIWAVVLFTDDWLGSQNHQIHLPTVTFITVIFKVTATCLVSQHWPPHIYSHLFSPSLFLSLHLSSSLVLSLGIWSVTLLLFLRPPSPFSPSFNYFLSDFLSVSLQCPHPLLAVHLFSHSARQVEGKQGQGGVERDRGKRGEKRENKTPSSSIVWRVCSESLYRSLSRDGKKFVLHSSPAVLHWRRNSPVPKTRRM